jgi:hypothetical protein
VRFPVATIGIGQEVGLKPRAYRLFAAGAD